MLLCQQHKSKMGKEKKKNEGEEGKVVIFVSATPPSYQVSFLLTCLKESHDVKVLL